MTRKSQSFALILAALMSVVVLVSLIPHAVASVAIFSIDPDLAGIGANVSLAGNVTTLNGAFNVTWDNGTILLAQGSAIGYDVNVNFTVPQAGAGLHNVTLSDVTTGERASGVFEVQTGLFEYLFQWWAATISAGSIFLAFVGVYLYFSSRRSRSEGSLKLEEKLSRSTKHFVFVWVLLGLLVFYIVSIDIGSDVLFAAGNILVEIMLLVYLFRNKTRT